MPNQTLSTEQVAEKLGTSTSSFTRVRCYLEGFPAPIKIDRKNVYDQAAIEKWLETHNAKELVRNAYSKITKGQGAIELQINIAAKAFVLPYCKRIKSTAPPLPEKYKNYRKTDRIKADF